MEILQFDFDATFSVDTEQRTITGRVFPFDETVVKNGKKHRFAPGLTEGIDLSRTKLLLHHDRNRPVGRVTKWHEDETGVFMTFSVAKTREGNEALELASEGLVGLSAGIVAGEQLPDGTHTRLAAVPESSLVAFPAFAGAVITATNFEENMSDTPNTQEEVVELNASTDLTQFEAQIEALTAQVSELVNSPKPSRRPQAPTVSGWIAAQVNEDAAEKFAADWETFAALADIVSDGGVTPDASDLSPNAYLASELVHNLNGRRPLFSSFGSLPFELPKIEIPEVTQAVSVGKRSAQKSDVNTRALLTDLMTFSPIWFDGGADIARELVAETSSPRAIAIVETVWASLRDEYAKATEAEAVEQFNLYELGDEFTGASLRVDSYANFAKDVATAAKTVRENTGFHATELAVTDAQWIEIVSMVDEMDRRQFAQNGPSNSDASAALNAESLMLPGGIRVFNVPGANVAAIYTREAVKASEMSLIEATSINVQKMGIDVGLLGAIYIAPIRPNGLVYFASEE